MKPFLLRASCKDYIWGGNRLRDFGKASDADRIAESWELSCHPDGESVIASGEFEGMTLTAFLQKHPEAAGNNCRKFDSFPVIVKLIDAHDDLSVQVHPDKTELWYVVDAEPGAAILYGFREEITQAAFREAIENGTLLEKMNRISVKPGDVFLIPTGTLHAIGKGILIAEVQQNSNITYRVFDHDRGRELHVEQAMEVTKLSPSQNPAAKGSHPIPETGCTFQVLGICKYFTAVKYELFEQTKFLSGASFVHLLVLDGEMLMTSEDEQLSLQKGSSVFVPAKTAFTLSGNSTILTVQGGVRTPLRSIKR